jgi:hypothetical protein
MSLLSASMELFSSSTHIFLDAASQTPRQSNPTVPTSGHTLREVGLLSGTAVATGSGWCAVERIVANDPLLTSDNGMRAVVQNRRVVLRRADIPDHKAFTMSIPRGVLGNRAAMNILPMQEIVMDSEMAERLYGTAFVLLPSVLLDGYKGITRHPIETNLNLHMLTFKDEQIISVNGGVLMLAQSETCFSPCAQTLVSPQSVYPRLTHAQLLSLLAPQQGLA